MIPEALNAYPSAPHGPVVDSYHGREIPDPYRWLEDVESPQTDGWIAAQNALTETYLSGVAQRAAIRARLEAVWNYIRRSTPSREGANYAYFQNNGLQNQPVLYVTPVLDEPARVLIDPNGLSADGTIALSGLAFSHDGSRVAYALSASGSDWLDWHVRDVATGQDAADVVRWSKFSGAAWTADGSGFYYSRYDTPADDAFKAANYNHKLYFHGLGTSQDADVLVYERPDHKDWNMAPGVSEDGRWLIITISKGTEPQNRIFVRDLTIESAPVIELLPDGDGKYDFIGNDGTRIYFATTLDAPLGRVISVDVLARDKREVIPESAHTLDGVALFGDQFFAHYLQDAHSAVRIFDMSGTAVGALTMPGLGTAGGFSGKRYDAEMFFSFTSYTQPATIYRYVFATSEWLAVFTPELAFDPNVYASEQVFYTSKDGTRVPMIVTRKKDSPKNGSAPTILYGYGGFNISLTPAFSPSIQVWLEMGGTYAVANLRGGGEYGQSWHMAGTRERKQNVFDDFIAAAEYLIDNKYTRCDKLAAMGASNGGLLVGAVLAQRPELFGAALPAVGVLDMLRFQKFTIGWAWESDYGSSDDPEEFKWLLSYSPLHNLRTGIRYPATLVTTGDHDDRVFPGHSFKFAARLQEVQAGPAPVLIRIDAKAGHGAGKPTTKVIAETADRYAFLMRALSID